MQYEYNRTCIDYEQAKVGYGVGISSYCRDCAFSILALDQPVVDAVMHGLDGSSVIQ